MNQYLPETAQLEAFCALVEHLHFGRAAAALYVSQSTISHRIRALEERVGVTLFARSKRRVRLTPAGTAFLRRVTTALHDLERGGVDARAAAAGHEGRLVLGYSGAVSSTGVVEAAAAVVEAMPTLRLELQRRSLHEQLAAIRAGDLDAGTTFLELPQEHIGLRCESLAPRPLWAWVNVGHPLARVEATSFDALRSERWIVLSERAEAGFRHFLRDLGHTTTAAHVEVDALDAAFELVRCGVGICVMPHTHVVPRGVARVRLSPSVHATVRVFWDEGRTTPALQHFLRALVTPAPLGIEPPAHAKGAPAAPAAGAPLGSPARANGDV